MYLTKNVRKIITAVLFTQMIYTNFQLLIIPLICMISIMTKFLKIKHVLKEKSKIAIVVEGNADERGSKAYNKALGERRAKAVESFLVQEGVDPAKIKIVTFGEDNPVDPAHNEDAWALNRRDDFHIYIK